jgi:signal transduction histidine kinase
VHAMRRIGSAAGTVFWLVSFAFPIALDAQPLPRSMLVLDQSEVRGPFYHSIFSGLRSTVNARSGSPVTIYVESLDLSRFTGRDYEESLQAHFRQKYRDKPIGVLVAVGSATLDFVMRRRGELWPGVPVVFAMVDEPTVERLKLPPDVTGRIAKLRFEDMMIAARAVVPNLEAVAILGDPLRSQTVFRHFADEIPVSAANVEVIDLTGLPMKELRKRVAILPDRTAILYTAIYSDGEGTFYPPADAVALVAEVANRPIVVTVETNLGRGSIGGFVLTPSAIGEEAAQLALRILDGENASSIPVTTGDIVRPVFDGRQLRRWAVSEARLPPGSEIRFRDPTAWEQYRVHFLAVGAAIVLQAMLIFWLLYEQRQRRRSEVSAHMLSGRLIHAQEEERSRLARELHDDVTQRLASLAIDAGREERVLSGSARATVRTMREGLARLSEDVHALSYRLHPSILEDLGLIEALRAECERFSRRCPIRLEADARDLPERPPPDVALCLFRIAQEGLRNIARHAKASEAEVCLRRLDGGLQLAVRDNGAGFDPKQDRVRMSLGHASMRQRVFLLGGKVEVDSRPGHGTTIRAWVPLKEDRSEPATRAVG